MRLVPANPGDAGALARILAGWAHETAWMPEAPRDARDYLARLIQDSEVLTLRDWGGLQGFLAREGEMIHALYLRPRVRGRGHGKALLDHAKAESPRLTLWAFQANAAARRFYAREGFFEVEKTDGAGNDEKLPDVRLTWERPGGMG